MAIGIVGKPSGTRMITGSVHYGKSKNQSRNLQYREYPKNFRGRTILIIGQRHKAKRQTR